MTESAGVLRRFGAMLYDALLLVLAVLPITTAIFLAFTHEAITPGGSGLVEHIYQGCTAARDRALLQRVLDVERPDSGHARVALASGAQRWRSC